MATPEKAFLDELYFLCRGKTDLREMGRSPFEGACEEEKIQDSSPGLFSFWMDREGGVFNHFFLKSTSDPNCHFVQITIGNRQGYKLPFAYTSQPNQIPYWILLKMGMIRDNLEKNPVLREVGPRIIQH
jgi:hypothetical protein